MKHVKLSLLLVIALQLGNLQAQNYFSGLLPTIPDAQVARQLSLGFSSIGSAGTATALRYNPALVFAAQARMTATFSLGLTGWSERRTYPILDSFGDYLADNTYVANRDIFPSFSVGILLKPRQNLCLGLSWVSGYQGKFDYEEEVRGSLTGQYNRDPLVGYHRIQIENKLRQLGMGVAYKWRTLQLGVAFQYQPVLENQAKWAVEVIQKDVRLAADTTTIYHSDQSTETGLQTTLGLSWQATPRLQLALAYQSPYEVKLTKAVLTMVNDATQQLPQQRLDVLQAVKSIDRQYPAQYRLACKYVPVNIVPTKFILELAYQPYSNFEQQVRFNPNAYVTATDSALYRAPFELRDVLNWSLGVEHSLFSGLDMRVGFAVDRSPLGNDLNRVWFTAGIGSQIGKLRLDFGGAIATCEYKYPDLFIIPTEQRLSYDTVHEFWWLGRLNIHYAM